MTTCPVCGTAVVAGARFCFACGTPLSVEDAGTERRVVTVVFGDLTDFTGWAEDLDPERVGAVTDRVLALLTEAVAEFGGHVDKLTGDGLMAVFGAPTAHEDDPERAVRAAARMQHAVRDLVAQETGGGRQLGLRVGLNTGTVAAGVQAHRSYTVVGDTVNTAARLADAAGPGAVLAGRDTAAATMSVASWRALPPLRLKGKREPVGAYELVRLLPAGVERSGLGDGAPLLGREAELGRLVGRLHDAADRGQPATVVVTGEAGVGKTRLAGELGRIAADLPGARVLWGRCPPYGAGRDLAPVAEIVRTACGAAPDDPPDRLRERVVRTVARLGHPARGGPLPPGTTDGLLRLLGLATGGQRDGATPGGSEPGDAVCAAVRSLLRALARLGPVLVVLDDLQWATPTLLADLAEVTAGLSGPVLLVALGRPDQAAVSALAGLPGVELLPLLPLERAASERLLRAYLGGSDQDVDPAAREALLERAQGNPFFLAELLHLLVDRGVLHRDGDRWLLTGPVPADVPAGVQAVLAARVDELGGTAKGVLRDASVLGDHGDLPGLVAVGRASGHGDPAVVAAALPVLVQRGLLEPVDDGWRFTHTLVRDVAYRGLAKAERARRHAAAACYAAESPADAAQHGERAARLAAEMSLPLADPAWLAAAPGAAALAELAVAAAGRDDNAGAEQLAARALELAGLAGADVSPAVAQRARLVRAKALAALRRLAEAAAELDRADRDDPAALVVRGDLLRKSGDPDGARRALELAAGAADPVVAGEAVRELGLLDYFAGRLRAAEERFAQAGQLADAAGDRRGAAWALQHLAWSATTRGDYDRADLALAEAGQLFTELADGGGLSWVAGTEGFIRLLQGRLHEARELARATLPAGQAVGEPWGVAALLTIDALAAAYLGDLSTAAREAEQAQQAFAELGDSWGAALALVAGGAAARAAGDPQRAVRLLTESVQRSEEGGHPLTAALALVALGYAQLDLHDLPAAAAAGERAAGVAAGLDLEPPATLGAAVLLAQVRRAAGDPAAALAQLDAALAAATGPALLFSRRQALAHRAGTLLDLGQLAEAEAAATAALAEPAEDLRSRELALQAVAATRAALAATGGGR